MPGHIPKSGYATIKTVSALKSSAKLPKGLIKHVPGAYKHTQTYTQTHREKNYL